MNIVLFGCNRNDRQPCIEGTGFTGIVTQWRGMFRVFPMNPGVRLAGRCTEYARSLRLLKAPMRDQCL